MKGGLAGRSHSAECKRAYRNRGRKGDPVIVGNLSCRSGRCYSPTDNTIVSFGKAIVNALELNCYKI